MPNIDSMDEWQEWLIKETYHWVVPKRYTDLLPLGRGSFGLVCSATDTLKSTKIAIKKLSRPFETEIHAKRAYREIKLLKHVKHENIILLLDIFSKANSEHDLNDIYLCTNLMSTNLKEVLMDQQLTENQIKIFAYQILRGIKYLHSANIIHRDLKPDNITVQENLDLRIIDFGLARSETEKMTGYVANRWYRAPEIMLKWMNYSKAVDIWSIGCIVAEMYSQKVLFKGDDHINQLNLILEVTGFPSESLLNQINQDARVFLENKEPKLQRVDFNEYFSNIKSPDAVNLIDKMIELDPEIRINCEQALSHPFLLNFHDPDDEPISELFDDNYESEDCSIEEWKRRIFIEIKSFVPPSIENEQLTDNI